MSEDSLGVPLQDPSQVDLLEIEARAQIAEEATWPPDLETAYQNLRQVKPDRVVNAANLGDLAFVEAGARLADIVQVLTDLRLEEWKRVPPALASGAVGNANSLLATLTQMAELRSSQPDAQAQRNNLSASLDSHYEFFVHQIWPICITGRVRDVAQNNPDLLASGLTPERIAELRATFQKLEKDIQEFRGLSDLINTQRQLVGAEGVADLSSHFKSLATSSKTEFDKWAKRLWMATVIGGAAATAFVYLTRPANNAGTPQVVTHLALDVLVVGLVIFLIRFLAMQARAHRHVEFVSTNKANALSTFNLIVTGQEDPTVRAQVASALAQAVFKSDDGIFSDASSDSVTIVERVVGAVAAKPPVS
jgi:hypothetical protein